MKVKNLITINLIYCKLVKTVFKSVLANVLHLKNPGIIQLILMKKKIIMINTNNKETTQGRKEKANQIYFLFQSLYDKR